MKDQLSPIQDVGKAMELRKFVRDEFFPALCEATDSINDADMFLQSFSTMIMETFLHSMKEREFGEFDFVKKLDPQSPKFEAMKKMLQLFNNRTLRESQDLIDGFKDEMRFFYKKEMQDRKLDSIKFNWLADEKPPEEKK